MAALGQDDAPGAHPPQALPHLSRALSFRAFAAAFQYGQEVMVVITGHGAARQDGGLRAARQLIQGLAHPCSGRVAVQRGRVIQQAAAQFSLFVRNDDPGAALGRGQRRHQARRPAAGYQHITMYIKMLITIRVCLTGGDTQAGSMSEAVFVPAPQQPGRHEGLVVKPRAQQRGKEIIDRQQVRIEAGPAPGGRCDQAVVQLHFRGAQPGDGVRSRSHLHDGVGFFRADAHDATPAVVLETAGYRADAVRQQGGGQGVAGVTLERAAVEAERQGAGTVDAAAGGKAIRLHG